MVWRHVSQRHQQNESTGSIRMTNGHLDRRWRAGRPAQNGSLSDAQCVEQTNMGVRLCRRRRICRHWRAQIAKARHGDDADALLGQWASERHALILPAAAAVNRKQRDARASLLILNRPAAGLNDNAALRGARSGNGDVGLEASPYPKCEHCQNQSDNGDADACARQLPVSANSRSIKNRLKRSASSVFTKCADCSNQISFLRGTFNIWK